MALLQHKDFSLQALEIENSAGNSRIDIRRIFKELIIHEDMFSTVMAGSVMVVTSLPIDEVLPLTGQDRINIAFRSADKRNVIRQSFVLYKTSDIARNTDRSYMMILHFASPEAFINEKVRVCRQFDKEFSNNVVSAYAALGSDKPLTIGGQTKQKDKVLIPNWTPFYTINWFAHRSTPIDSSATATNYLFYEKISPGGNGSEFTYMPLNRIVGQNAVKTYIHTESNVGDGDKKQSDLNRNNVESYKIDSTYDHMKELSTGSLGGSNIMFDITRKRWDRHTYSYFDDFQNSNSLESNPNTASPKSERDAAGPRSHISLHMKEEGIFATSQEDSKIPSSHLENTVWRRKSFISRHNLTRCLIRTAGDSDLRLGSVVNWNLPSNQPQNSGAKKYNEYFDNRWYVSSIKHIIDNEEGYVQNIELLKDSVPKQLPSGSIFDIIKSFFNVGNTTSTQSANR